MTGTVDLGKYNELKKETFYRSLGKVEKVVGLTIESAGPEAKLGDVCMIKPVDKKMSSIIAEVVGFRGRSTLLMPYDSTDGIGLGCIVENTGSPLSVKVNDELLGKTVDGLGNCVDGTVINGEKYSVEAQPPDPMKRKIISDILPLGVKAVDGLMTIGKGQRIGIFAGSGVGKSTLLGMFARNTKADINVIALIGERGREVLEFIEKDLGEEGYRKSVVVCATSDSPPLVRLKGAYVATAIAEYYRDQGKKVILMMDSVTRVAMAQREIGLATGEPPTSKGYTPSVFTVLPKLLERSGMSEHGSITAFYTVLVEGDDMNEPIADAVRGILDGHIILSRKIAAENQYPAIDVQNSVSRLMKDIVPESHSRAAGMLKENMAIYAEAKDLIDVGAYRKGSSPEIDRAISLAPVIKNFLKQRVDEPHSHNEIVDTLQNLFK